MTQYNSLEAKEHFDEFDFYDNSLHINTINEPVAECTDNVQNYWCQLIEKVNKGYLSLWVFNLIQLTNTETLHTKNVANNE